MITAMLGIAVAQAEEPPARPEVVLDHGLLRIGGDEVPWADGKTWLFEASPEARAAHDRAVEVNLLAPLPIAAGAGALTFGVGAIVIGSLVTLAGDDGEVLIERGAVAAGLGGIAVVGGSLALRTWGGNARRRAVRAYAAKVTSD